MRLARRSHEPDYSTEMSLRSSANAYIVEELPEAIAVVEGNGKVILVNRRWEELFSNGSVDFEGEGADWLISACDSKPGPRPLGALGGQQVSHPDKRLFASTGAGLRIPIELSLSRIPMDGRNLVMITIRDLSECQRCERALHKLSTIDDLTGILNRRGFIRSANRILGLAARQGAFVSAFYLDLDGLKSINDQFGHRQGDEAIRQAAEILKTVFRTSDLVARWGGDEFVALTYGTEEAGAAVLTDRIRQAARRWNRQSRTPFDLRLSIGMVTLPARQNVDLDRILQRADRRMYADKRDHRSVGR